MCKINLTMYIFLQESGNLEGSKPSTKALGKDVKSQGYVLWISFKVKERHHRSHFLHSLLTNLLLAGLFPGTPGDWE